LADSGALYTIVPKEVLKAIGVKPYGTETFTPADGLTIRREVGNAFLQIDGDRLPVLSSLERKEMALSLASSLLNL
jgi:predicted aspartyl protease